MRIALPLCNQNGPFAWQKCLQIYNLFCLAVLNILSQPEKENFLSFPGLSLSGRPSWKGTRRRNSSGGLCLQKYLHIILPGGAFSLRCWEGWEIEGESPSCISVHTTIFLQQFALLLIERRSDGDLLLCKGTQCAASLGPRWTAPIRLPREQISPPPSRVRQPPFAICPWSPMAFAASNDCGRCASPSSTRSVWGADVKSALVGPAGWN